MSRIYLQMGNAWKPRFHELEHESNMRLLKTHSHSSERRGYEALRLKGFYRANIRKMCS